MLRFNFQTKVVLAAMFKFHFIIQFFQQDQKRGVGGTDEPIIWGA